MNTGRKDRRQCQFWPSFLAPIYYSVPLKDRRCLQFWPGWVHSNLHTRQTRTNLIKAHRVHKRLLSALSLRCLATLNFGKRNCHPEHNVLNTCKTMEKNKGTPSMHRGISKMEWGNRYLWRWEGHRFYHTATTRYGADQWFGCCNLKSKEGIHPMHHDLQCPQTLNVPSQVISSHSCR